jgi:hypothetical protein
LSPSQELRTSPTASLQAFEALLVTGQRVPPQIRELVSPSHPAAAASVAQASGARPFSGILHFGTGPALSSSSAPFPQPHPTLPFLMAADALAHVESVLAPPFELAATACRLVHRFLIMDSTMARVKHEGLRVQLRCQRANIATPTTCWPLQVDGNLNSLPVRIESVRGAQPADPFARV